MTQEKLGLEAILRRAEPWYVLGTQWPVCLEGRECSRSRKIRLCILQGPLDTEDGNDHVTSQSQWYFFTSALTMIVSLCGEGTWHQYQGTPALLLCVSVNWVGTCCPCFLVPRSRLAFLGSDFAQMSFVISYVLLCCNRHWEEGDRKQRLIGFSL